jgi:hypothetical protein
MGPGFQGTKSDLTTCKPDLLVSQMKIISILLFIAVGTSSAFAADALNSEVLRQLVEEVHLLRVTFKQTLTLQLSCQSLLEQIKDQRIVVNDLKQSITSSRELAKDQVRQRSNYEDDIKEIESDLVAETDRKEIGLKNADIKRQKKLIEQTYELESRYKERESEAQAALPKEETRLSELLTKIDDVTAAIKGLSQYNK